jgi:hypothetical protein
MGTHGYGVMDVSRAFPHLVQAVLVPEVGGSIAIPPHGATFLPGQ